MLTGEPVRWTTVRPRREHVVGSVLFGVGWAVADVCPGPIAAQLGQGMAWSLATTGGLVLGVAVPAPRMSAGGWREGRGHPDGGRAPLGGGPRALGGVLRVRARAGRDRARDGDTVTLGADLLVLTEVPGAVPADGYAGLFHFALLVPERADLARWLVHAARSEVPLTGLSDHFVSEAIYLDDPDGHGIEVYWDRPRALWEGQVAQRLTTAPLDVQDLVRGCRRRRGLRTSP